MMGRIYNTVASGFTLVEMAIVMMITGIILTTTASYYNTYIEKKRFDETKEKVDYATAILSTYSSGIYPCPSDRNLDIGHPDYGKPIGYDDPDGRAEGCKKIFDALAPNGCSANGGYCRMQIIPDPPRVVETDKDGDDEEDYIYIGGYPIKFMEDNDVKAAFNLSQTLDGYGNQLSYAVSANMTRYVGADPDNGDPPLETWGSITIQDEFANRTGGIDGNANYVVIAHGKDARGAFSSSGVLVAPCNTSTKTTDFTNLKGAAASVARQDDNGLAVDADNCDEDDVFRQALGNYEANSAMHFDDVIAYNVSNSILLWQHTVDADGKVTEHMRNLNTGNVGVGSVSDDATKKPDEKLMVVGTLRAESLARTKELCTLDGASCKDINIIVGSTGLNCPTGQAATALQNGTLTCANVGAEPNKGKATDAICGTGKFIQSFNADNTISCN